MTDDGAPIAPLKGPSVNLVLAEALSMVHAVERTGGKAVTPSTPHTAEHMTCKAEAPSTPPQPSRATALPYGGGVAATHPQPSRTATPPHCLTIAHGCKTRKPGTRHTGEHMVCKTEMPSTPHTAEHTEVALRTKCEMKTPNTMHTAAHTTRKAEATSWRTLGPRGLDKVDGAFHFFPHTLALHRLVQTTRYYRIATRA